MLGSLGLLPPESQVHEVENGVDLLPMLRREWNEFTSSRKPTRRVAELVDWLEQLSGNGHQMTLGFGAPTEQTHGDPSRCNIGFSNRVVLWPADILDARQQPWTSILSSRLGRALEEHGRWFDAFRTACVRLTGSDATVITAASMTCDPFIRRAASLIGMSVLAIDIKQRESPTAWLRRMRNMEPTSVPTAFVSPPLDGATAELPVIDQTIADLSDHAIVIHARLGGNLHNILAGRLTNSTSYGGVLIARGEGLSSVVVADELQNKGAVSWHLLSDSTEEQYPAATNARVVSSPIIPVPESDDWVYLTHCTRRRTGPWPDQQSDDYLDDLILDRRGKNHDCFAAVCRIAKHKRLYASDESIRGNTRVVCFSAVPLLELQDRRVFRAHRGRWDFEPYGICIRQKWLREMGARPVIYGDDEDWSTLTVGDRPFFQVRSSRANKTGDESDRVDWSAEREWRFIGDLDLSALTARDAFVFVPSATEARNLAMISSWPVALVSRADKDPPTPPTLRRG